MTLPIAKVGAHTADEQGAPASQRVLLDIYIKKNKNLVPAA